MTSPKPHYLLFCDGNYPASDVTALDGKLKKSARWRFVLEDIESGEKFEASDREVGATSDRMALVAVLRGLEALEQPSRVTLVTSSRYVFRGLQYGLTEWRDNDYSWEHFGSVQPIRNADLWRRIDRTLAIHKVQVRWITQDEPNQPDEATTNMASVDSPSSSVGEGGVQDKSLQQKCATTIAISDTNPAIQPNPQIAIFKDSGTRLSASCIIAPVRGCDIGVENVSTDKVCGKEEVEKSGNSRTEQAQRIELNPRDNHPIAGLRNTPLDKHLVRRCRYSLRKAAIRVKRNWLLGTQSIWNWFLKLDEEIEGYFRCMLLLEPKSPRRPHKSL